MRYLTGILISMLFINVANSESITNFQLLNFCQGKDSSGKSFCYGFIIGAANAAQFYRNVVDVNDKFVDICFPKDISNKEIVDLYIQWAKANPDLASSPAFIGVSTSFSQKYSCEDQNNDNNRKTYK